MILRCCSDLPISPVSNKSLPAPCRIQIISISKVNGLFPGLIVRVPTKLWLKYSLKSKAKTKKNLSNSRAELSGTIGLPFALTTIPLHWRWPGAYIVRVLFSFSLLNKCALTTARQMQIKRLSCKMMQTYARCIAKPRAFFCKPARSSKKHPQPWSAFLLHGII